MIQDITDLLEKKNENSSQGAEFCALHDKEKSRMRVEMIDSFLLKATSTTKSNSKDDDFSGNTPIADDCEPNLNEGKLFYFDKVDGKSGSSEFTNKKTSILELFETDLVKNSEYIELCTKKSSESDRKYYLVAFLDVFSHGYSSILSSSHSRVENRTAQSSQDANLDYPDNLSSHNDNHMKRLAEFERILHDVSKYCDQEIQMETEELEVDELLKLMATIELMNDNIMVLLSTVSCMKNKENENKQQRIFLLIPILMRCIFHGLKLFLLLYTKLKSTSKFPSSSIDTSIYQKAKETFASIIIVSILSFLQSKKLIDYLDEVKEPSCLSSTNKKNIFLDPDYSTAPPKTLSVIDIIFTMHYSVGNSIPDNHSHNESPTSYSHHPLLGLFSDKLQSIVNTSGSSPTTILLNDLKNLFPFLDIKFDSSIHPKTTTTMTTINTTLKGTIESLKTNPDFSLSKSATWATCGVTRRLAIELLKSIHIIVKSIKLEEARSNTSMEKESLAFQSVISFIGLEQMIQSLHSFYFDRKHRRKPMSSKPKANLTISKSMQVPISNFENYSENDSTHKKEEDEKESSLWRTNCVCVALLLVFHHNFTTQEQQVNYQISISNQNINQILSIICTLTKSVSNDSYFCSIGNALLLKFFQFLEKIPNNCNKSCAHNLHHLYENHFNILEAITDHSYKQHKNQVVFEHSSSSHMASEISTLQNNRAANEHIKNRILFGITLFTRCELFRYSLLLKTMNENNSNVKRREFTSDIFALLRKFSQMRRKSTLSYDDATDEQTNFFTYRSNVINDNKIIDILLTFGINPLLKQHVKMEEIGLAVADTMEISMDGLAGLLDLLVSLKDNTNEEEILTMAKTMTNTGLYSKCHTSSVLFVHSIAALLLLMMSSSPVIKYHGEKIICTLLSCLKWCNKIQELQTDYKTTLTNLILQTSSVTFILCKERAEDILSRIEKCESNTIDTTVLSLPTTDINENFHQAIRKGAVKILGQIHNTNM